MTEKRFINHDDTILDSQGEQLISTDEIVDKMNELAEENEQLKQQVEEQKRQIKGFILMKNGLIDDCMKLSEENEQLKQRNDRQLKQLDRLYRLIEEKDWRTLTDIINDFKKCDEQLQREWGTYGDVE